MNDMNIEKLRKRHFTFHRKKRRKLYLKAYNTLKSEIRRESRRGELFVRFKGNFIYEYAVAARLFYRKNKDFYVRVKIEEKGWLSKFKTSEIYIDWSGKKEPMLEEIIFFRGDKDEEEEDSL